MGRYVLTFLKLLAGLLFLAGLGLYVFRVPLMDSLLIAQLARLGVPVNSITVKEVSLNELEIRKLSLGAANELRADKISATWTLPGLFEGELQRVEISGLQLLLDLTGKNPPLGSLQKLIGNEGDTENGKLPQISLLDAIVDLHTTSGNFIVNLHGDVKPGPSDQNLIAFNIETTAEPGHVIADLTATLEADGKLQGVLTVAEAALSLPDLNISDIRGKSSFEWKDNQPQAISADFVLSRIGLPIAGLEDETFEQGAISLQMNATDARMKGELLAAEHASGLAFTLALNDYRHQPGIVADVTAEVNADSVIWRLFGLSEPGKGSASLSVRADGKTPALQTAGDNWRSWLQHSTLQGQGILRLDGLDFAQKVADLNGDVEIKTELADGLGQLTLTKDSSIEASGLNSDWLERLGIPSTLLTELKPDTKLRIKSKGENSANVTIDMIADGIQMDLATDLEFSIDKSRADISAQAEVTISPQNQVTAFTLDEVNIIASGFEYAGNTIDKLTLSGNLQGSADTWSGELDLAADVKRFQLEQLDARKTSVTLPMWVNFKEQGGQLSLRKPGKMTVAELVPFKAFGVKGPLELRLPRSDIRFAWGSQGLSLENQITLQPGSFTLLVNRDDAPALEMEIRPGKISHTGKMENTGQFNGKSTISAAGITMPQYQIQLEKITTTISHGESGKRQLADFTMGRLQHLAPKPYFAPISLAGDVKLMRKRLFINALGGIPGKRYLKFAAEHGLDTGEGSLKLDVTPLTFSPGALQPVALIPDLAMLESVSGSASASSHISWLQQGIKSGAEINLQNLSFTQNGTTISGLSATLQLTDLLSPSSLPQQKITIQRIDPGVPMENIEIIYKIQGTDSTQLAIDKARLSMIGGTLSTGPTVIDPLSSSTNVVLQVADLDLDVLFKLIDVEGLTGDGRLDGRVPMTLRDNSVSIQDGVLAAKKPGILRLNSEKVSKLLAGSAEDVDLLLQALTDFHYTELTLKLNNSAKNDLLTTVSLLGNNPKVLQGRLFRLNINLESNISDLLKALGQAYGVSSKALQRAFRLR
jgi:hypothetical protein